jgi:ABC-type sugar transport system substrate-binding protein
LERCSERRLDGSLNKENEVKRVLATMAVVVLAGSGLAACGSSDSGSAATGDGKLKAGGKVGMVLSDGSSEVEQRWATTAKASMKKIGWTVTVVDGKNDPAIYQQAMTSFINQKVSGIITVALDAAPITSSLRAAKEADIPVIATGISIDPAGEDLFSAFYAPDDSKLGQVTADYLKDNVPSGSEYVVLDLTAVYGAHKPVTAATPVLDKAGFKLTGTHDISTSDILGSATKGAVDLMSAHPEAKFMFGCCDFTPALTVPALKAAGFEDVIQTARYDNLSTLKLIRDGAPVVAAVTDADNGVLISLDQILANAATGAKIDRSADKDKYQYDLVDKTNLPAEGAFVYDAETQIADHVSEWKSKYGL